MKVLSLLSPFYQQKTRCATSKRVGQIWVLAVNANGSAGFSSRWTSASKELSANFSETPQQPSLTQLHNNRHKTLYAALLLLKAYRKANRFNHLAYGWRRCLRGASDRWLRPAAASHTEERLFLQIPRQSH
jgi:hypothetical protein